MKSVIYVILTLLIITACEGNNSNSDNTIPDRPAREPAETISNPTGGTWQDAEEKPLELTLELTIGNDTDFMLPASWKIVGPVADEGGTIYFIDRANSHMYAFDSTGTQQWVTGKKGKGPDDFSQPRGIALNQSHLFVSNINGTRIDRYNFNGELMENFALPEDLSFTNLIGFIHDSLLVTENTLWGEAGSKVIVFNVNNEFNKVLEFEVPSDPQIKFISGFSSGFGFNVLDTLIVAGNLGNYALQFYNREGEYVRKVKRDFDKLVKPGLYSRGGGGTIRSFGGLSAPYRLLPNYFVVQYQWPDNLDDPDAYVKKAAQGEENLPDLKQRNGMDLYDQNFNLLYVSTFDGSDYPIGKIVYSDGSGHIYTKSNQPFPQIRRYWIRVKSPDE